MSGWHTDGGWQELCLKRTEQRDVAVQVSQELAADLRAERERSRRWAALSIATLIFLFSTCCLLWRVCAGLRHDIAELKHEISNTEKP